MRSEGSPSCSARRPTAQVRVQNHEVLFLQGVQTHFRKFKADFSSSSGVETGWTDLTALAVVSIHLYDKDGRSIQVSDPIHVSVPLPSDTRNRMATSVPAWLYQPKTGTRISISFEYLPLFKVLSVKQ